MSDLPLTIGHMRFEDRIQAKRWNEHIGLLITALNLTAIGAFGLSVTAPIVAHLSSRVQYLQPENGEYSKFQALFEGLTVLDVVLWDVALASLAAHLCAHMLIRVTEAED